MPPTPPPPPIACASTPSASRPSVVIEPEFVDTDEARTRADAPCSAHRKADLGSASKGDCAGAAAIAAAAADRLRENSRRFAPAVAIVAALVTVTSPAVAASPPSIPMATPIVLDPPPSSLAEMTDGGGGAGAAAAADRLREDRRRSLAQGRDAPARRHFHRAGRAAAATPGAPGSGDLVVRHQRQRHRRLGVAAAAADRLGKDADQFDADRADHALLVTRYIPRRCRPIAGPPPTASDTAFALRKTPRPRL